MLILSFLSTLALKIECNYVVKENVITECLVFGLEVKYSNETVTSISGDLPGELKYDEIKAFRVTASPTLRFLPSGINTFFPNLEEFEVSQSGLKNLSQKDLKNFSKLKILILNNNQLENLESDVFKLNDKIEEIDLSGNKLIDVRVVSLKVLKNLKKLDLSNNLCVNETSTNQQELKELKIKLRDKCSPSSRTSYIDFLLTFGFFCLIAASFAFLLYFAINRIARK